jgi:hypothetical protein
MRQEGGEECEECPCLCRLHSAHWRARPRQRIKARAARPAHTTILPAEKRQPEPLQPQATSDRPTDRPIAASPTAAAPTHIPETTTAPTSAQRQRRLPPTNRQTDRPTDSPLRPDHDRRRGPSALRLRAPPCALHPGKRREPSLRSAVERDGGRDGDREDRVTPSEQARERASADRPFSLQPSSGQDCSGQCQCSDPAPSCPAGVSLVLDGCGCCLVCAKQLGELCSERDPCDPHKGLFCDFGSPANRKTGVCTGKPSRRHLVSHHLPSLAQPLQMSPFLQLLAVLTSPRSPDALIVRALGPSI